MQGRNEEGHNSREPITEGAAEKSQCQQHVLQYITFASKDLRFEHGDAKLASCPGRHLPCYATGCMQGEYRYLGAGKCPLQGVWLR